MEPEIPVSNMGASLVDGLELLDLSPISTVEASAIAHRSICNPHRTPAQLHISPVAQPYTIPPHSSFHLTSIDSHSTAALSQAASTLHATSTATAGPGQFDFILLDPPWANRSVRRSSSYKTSEDVNSDPLDALQGMLGRHIPAKGLVGCWITNKAASRRQALEAFQAWKVRLIEQWVWVKTTVNGEPVTAIDGIWRKPYEMLLLGRRSSRDEEVEEAEEARRQDGVAKRVIVGVPDLHSRKPCLKELIAPMMEDRGTYRGLEIFARHLTAGWCAWGDEVLKFNWEGHWSKGDVAVDAPASLHMPEYGVTSTLNPFARSRSPAGLEQ
ncbi:MAG: hypothetical protein LQ347_001778 [Umbilicaria vellea]|nr:MAG: hypothetical protein LQ347_001778 [Umbilicaria vellea]